MYIVNRYGWPTVKKKIKKNKKITPRLPMAARKRKWLQDLKCPKFQMFVFFVCFPCARAELHQQKRARKLCSVNGALSSASKLTCRVPQSCILGHLHFLKYIKDTPNCRDTACVRIEAEDTNIVTSGSTLADLEKRTNSELMELYCWQQANKISLDIAKTELPPETSCRKLSAELITLNH